MDSKQAESFLGRIAILAAIASISSLATHGPLGIAPLSESNEQGVASDGCQIN